MTTANAAANREKVAGTNPSGTKQVSQNPAKSAAAHSPTHSATGHSGANSAKQAERMEMTQKPADPKQSEKLAERRRALGRGLESLLPGPRLASSSGAGFGATVPTPATAVVADASVQTGSPALSTLNVASAPFKGGTPDPQNGAGALVSAQDAPSLAAQGTVPSAAAANVSPESVRASELRQSRSVEIAQTAISRDVAPSFEGNVIREIRASVIADGEVEEIEIEQIDLNPYQTRQEFDEQLLKDLAASIEVQGVMQPIVVRPAPVRPSPVKLQPSQSATITPISSTAGTHSADASDSSSSAAQAGLAAASHALANRVSGEQGSATDDFANPAPTSAGFAAPATDGLAVRERFILILGERRLRASKLLGRKTIPAVVKRVSEQTAAEMTLVENLQRADLGCLEQANAFRNLSQNFLMTQEAIAKRVGVSREQVSNYMRLLNLPADVYLALQKKELTYSHARLLLTLHSDEHRSRLAQAAVKQKMSVGKLEELVMETVTTDPKEKRPGMARWLDPNVKAAQRSIEAAIGLRVRISDRKGKGKITIEYGSLEDFDRVVGKLKN